jgi:curli biogenesis system outer membrane secretion channel CsgG
MGQVQQQRYDGPKARLAVVKFVNKTAEGGEELGDGMADMLTTALFHTNRYLLLDRTDLQGVIDEQDLAASGRVAVSTGAAMGEIEGAELLVFGAVTEFKKDHIGAGGIILGALSLGASIAIATANRDAPVGLVTYKESYVAMDLKIVDAATGRVVYAGTVAGTYNQMGGGLVGGVGGGASRVPVGLGGFVGTGADEAIRKCVDAAVGDIVAHTPADYYRVAETVDFTPAGAMLDPRPLTFPATAAADGIKGPSHKVVKDQKGYLDLLVKLKVDPVAAPPVDFSRQRLIAVFGGKRSTNDWRIGVRKVVKKGKGLSVTVAQVRVTPPEPLPAADGRKVEAGQAVALGSAWPFEVVVIADVKTPVTDVVWEK